MSITKALGLWLFAVGVFWTVGFVWFHLSMLTITEPVLPLPLHFVLAVIGPAILIIGSTMAMALWHTRVAAILVFIGCICFTLEIAPQLPDIWREAPHLDPRLSRLEYAILVPLGLIMLLADTAALALLRRVYKKTI